MELSKQKHPVMPVGVNFRTPVSDDLEAIQAGWKKAVPFAPLESWLESFRDFVLPSKEKGFSKIAVRAGKIIGFASVLGEALRAIYVEDKYRRQGIGTALLSEMIESVQSKGGSHLNVATSHAWVGTIKGIDVRHAEAIRFLGHRGFERGRIITDVEAEFQDIEAAPQPRSLKHVVSEYRTEELEDMIAFVKRLGKKVWVWPDWIDQYRHYNQKRVRLLARVDGELIGCVDALISPSGVAGISYIALLPDYRRRGIGSGLLREAAKILKQRGATSMFAPIVPRKFYEVNGWRVNREYAVMTRQLSG
ncbi:MAG: GNAT family N-acetyltransferase [Gemmatimonadetes bacterium]|nr:GNAT family N-acetyltransferase [Gemmatimonadota bacterium]